MTPKVKFLVKLHTWVPTSFQVGVGKKPAKENVCDVSNAFNSVKEDFLADVFEIKVSKESFSSTISFSAWESKRNFFGF